MTHTAAIETEASAAIVPFAPPLGAVVYEDGGAGVEPFLTGLARDLIQRGWRLGGAVQTNVARDDRCLCDMELTDLAGSGSAVKISEDRGPEARGCRLDVSTFETLMTACLQSISPQLDLVIVNKFGKREAEGAGFRSVIEAAITAGVPVLVGLKASNVDTWRSYVGGDAVLLTTERDSVERWLVLACKRPLARRSA